jgi:hypothetical protein
MTITTPILSQKVKKHCKFALHAVDNKFTQDLH